MGTPTAGASLFKVPGSDGLVLPVAPVAGSPSVTSLTFRFPKPSGVDGLAVALRPHAVLTWEQATGRVGVAVSDELLDPIVGDTQGTITGTQNAPVVAPLAMLLGPGDLFFELQRFVGAQGVWTFTLENDDTANAITVAGIYLSLRELAR